MWKNFLIHPSVGDGRSYSVVSMREFIMTVYMIFRVTRKLHRLSGATIVRGGLKINHVHVHVNTSPTSVMKSTYLSFDEIGDHLPNLLEFRLAIVVAGAG